MKEPERQTTESAVIAQKQEDEEQKQGTATRSTVPAAFYQAPKETRPFDYTHMPFHPPNNILTQISFSNIGSTCLHIIVALEHRSVFESLAANAKNFIGVKKRLHIAKLLTRV